MSVRLKTSEFLLAMPESRKRVKVYDQNEKWVDTIPMRVDGLSESILKHLLPLLPVSKRDSVADKEEVFSGVSKNDNGNASK
jgi:hypothetical protein